MKSISNKPTLIDTHERTLHKLRVQLTDTCNFRCFYCMPVKAKFMPPGKLLGAAELVDICSGLVALGINEIRLSGGEPTLRADFEGIVTGLSNLPLLKLGVTTNGFFLEGKLVFLKNTNCQHINVSLDSLRPERFHMITRTKHFTTVQDAIIKARVMGFHVKVNVVAMRGLNTDEIFDFVNFSARYKIEVRFLELMKIGPYYASHSRLFVSAQELIEQIETREKLFVQSVNRDSTSFNFTTSSGAQIGFIASESQPFCDFCSRLRLTANGTLRACLMSEAGINLRGQAKNEYPKLLASVMAMKPTGRLPYIEQPMYQIGG